MRALGCAFHLDGDERSLDNTWHGEPQRVLHSLKCILMRQLDSAWPFFRRVLVGISRVRSHGDCCEP